MKYIKTYEGLFDFFKKKKYNKIESICQKYSIANYTINPDGTIDVDGDVNLSDKDLTKIPLKFGRVTGDFYCFNNELTTLEGGPEYVGGNFNCFNNELTTLEGGPKEVGGNFYCDHNKLMTLEGSPKSVGGNFYCVVNKLTTLEGGPKYVGGYFSCHDNQLTTLEGGPKEVGGDFYCGDNPIYQIYKLFGNYKSYLDSLDYSYLRGTGIVRSRFKEALEEIDKDLPESIPGYKYI